MRLGSSYFSSILKQIELVLKKAGDKNDCMVTNNEVDQAFRDVDKVIKDYLASHPVRSFVSYVKNQAEYVSIVGFADRRLRNCECG